VTVIEVGFFGVGHAMGFELCADRDNITLVPRLVLPILFRTVNEFGHLRVVRPEHSS